MKPLLTGYIRKIVDGALVQGTDMLPIQHGAYRLKQIRHPNTLLFLKRKLVKWDRLKPFFPIAIITDRIFEVREYENDLTIIHVKNFDKAYWNFINDYRSQINIPIVAVTGTSGKTTTKEMIRHLLSERMTIAHTASTNNSRTAHLHYLLSIDEQTDAAVFETAVGAPGDLTNAAAYLKPNIGIITNIGEHHLNYCKTIEGYIAAKGEIMKALEPNGVLIVNADDERTQTLDLINFKGKLITIGIDANCTFRASQVYYGVKGMYFTLHHKDITECMFVPGLGVHQVYNALCAIAAAHEIGMPLEQISERLKSFETLNKQLQIIDGLNGSTIIDDTWSLTTTSLKAAMHVLQAVGHKKRKVAVIGTVTDLGSWGYIIHELAGDIINEVGTDVLITIGKHARIMADRVKEIGKIKEVYAFNSELLAIDLLKRIVDDQTIVLVKGDMYSKALKEVAVQLRKK